MEPRGYQIIERMRGAELDVICVRYVGAYPALGLHDPQSRAELGRLISETADRLPGTRGVAALSTFIATSGVDWARRAAEILGR